MLQQLLAQGHSLASVSNICVILAVLSKGKKSESGSAFFWVMSTLGGDAVEVCPPLLSPPLMTATYVFVTCGKYSHNFLVNVCLNLFLPS